MGVERVVLQKQVPLGSRLKHEKKKSPISESRALDDEAAGKLVVKSTILCRTRKNDSVATYYIVFNEQFAETDCEFLNKSLRRRFRTNKTTNIHYSDIFQLL